MELEKTPMFYNGKYEKSKNNGTNKFLKWRCYLCSGDDDVQLLLLVVVVLAGDLRVAYFILFRPRDSPVLCVPFLCS